MKHRCLKCNDDDGDDGDDDGDDEDDDDDDDDDDDLQMLGQRQHLLNYVLCLPHGRLAPYQQG